MSDINYSFSPVRDTVPPLPWHVDPYGFSLAQIRDARGELVLDQINIAIAEFIVQKVNQGESE
jgi:hypothetical protein